jgi:hypothetical protein
MNRERRQFKKFYSIVLNSDDGVTSGTGEFQFVARLSIGQLSPNAVIAVESFYSSVSISNAFYHVCVRELMQPLSFYSRTKGQTDRVLTLSGQTFFQTDSVLETGLSALGFDGVSKTLTVRFLDNHGAVIVPTGLSGTTGSWELTLVIYDLDPTPAGGLNAGPARYEVPAISPAHSAHTTSRYS